MQNASHNSTNSQQRDGCENTAPSPTQETECLPEENVSIIEDMTTEDKLENMKAIVSGTMRRKLYFNPAYFEPHLLMVCKIYYFFSNFLVFLFFENQYIDCMLNFSHHRQRLLNFLQKFVKLSHWPNIKWQQNVSSHR